MSQENYRPMPEHLLGCTFRNLRKLLNLSQQPVFVDEDSNACVNPGFFGYRPGHAAHEARMLHPKEGQADRLLADEEFWLKAGSYLGVGPTQDEMFSQLFSEVERSHEYINKLRLAERSGHTLFSRCCTWRDIPFIEGLDLALTADEAVAAYVEYRKEKHRSVEPTSEAQAEAIDAANERAVDEFRNAWPKWVEHRKRIESADEPEFATVGGADERAALAFCEEWREWVDYVDFYKDGVVEQKTRTP